MRPLLVYSLLLIIWAPAPAQNNPSDIRFRLAQSYEKSGDFESALRVYYELFEADSGNFMLIEALKRGNLQLKRHEEVVSLIHHSLTLNPSDIGALAQLGGTYILMAEEERAYEAWDRAIAVEPTGETTYRVVGSAMTQSRLFEKAIETYRLARKNCSNPSLFISDIAYLYGILLKYRESAEEYLALLRQTPSQLGYIQSRLAGFVTREEGLRTTTGVVKSAVEREDKNVEFRRLLAWLYMEAKDFGGAYEAYLGIDRLVGANGRELFGFAERALREKSYASAAKAYTGVIDSHPEFPLMAKARFGLARSLEELDSVVVTDDAPDRIPFDAALSGYLKIIGDYPRTEIAARSLYRLAVIRHETLHDPAGAMEYLETIAADYRTFLPTATQARLMLAEICIALDQRDRASKILTELAGNAPYGTPHREKAALELAELDFYDGRYAEALEILSGLLQNPLSDAANDAISMQVLIHQNQKENPDILKRYAGSQLLQRQKKFTEALEILDGILTSEPDNALLDLCAYRKGEILSGLNRPDELEKFPDSIQANEARKRIRDLRGDNI
jgi:tetratricopeptide (TPR) repeat protein